MDIHAMLTVRRRTRNSLASMGSSSSCMVVTASVSCGSVAVTAWVSRPARWYMSYEDPRKLDDVDAAKVPPTPATCCTSLRA